MTNHKLPLRSEFRDLHRIERKRIPATPPEALRLHRLEKPTRWPPEMLTKGSPYNYLFDQVAISFHQYPDYIGFKSRLCEFFNVDESRLVMGAGIEDFIRTLMLICCKPGDRVVYTHPTCAMFDVYSRVFSLTPKLLTTPPGQPLAVHDITRSIDPFTRLVIIPNPGQPVETNYTPQELAVVAERCKQVGAVLAIDEAYYGFGANTSLSLTDTYENVVVLRTFSKAFGAAGIRVGFAVAGEFLARSLDAIRESGEIAGPSMIIARYLMDHYTDTVAVSVRSVCEGRDYLRDCINDYPGLQAWGQWANHVLIQLPSADLCKQVASAMWSDGIRVKADYPAPLDRCMLVTAGSVKLMQIFTDRFYDIFEAESQLVGVCDG